MGTGVQMGEKSKRARFSLSTSGQSCPRVFGRRPPTSLFYSYTHFNFCGCQFWLLLSFLVCCLPLLPCDFVVFAVLPITPSCFLVDASFSCFVPGIVFAVFLLSVSPPPPLFIIPSPASERGYVRIHRQGGAKCLSARS